MYLPGVVGLNNIKANDYCNVVLQALCHVKPLRDYFLREENYENIKRPAGDNRWIWMWWFEALLEYRALNTVNYKNCYDYTFQFPDRPKIWWTDEETMESS